MAFGFNSAMFGIRNNQNDTRNNRLWSNEERRIPISKGEFDMLRNCLVNQGDFNFYETEVKDHLKRRDQCIKDIEANFRALQLADDDKEAYIEIEGKNVLTDKSRNLKSSGYPTR
jgi:hypothetical protein